MRLLIPLLLAASPLLFAHPMGNFSVNHYARIEVASGGSKLIYALDIAELPTLELLQRWDLAGREAEAIQTSANAHAGEWMANLVITSNGKPVRLRIRKVESHVTEGAGGMPVLRVQVDAALDVAPGSIEYEDRNFPMRAGWKEVVIVAGRDALLSTASHSGNDVSHALTAYPGDPNVVPPQDVRASLTWRQTTPMVAGVKAPQAPPAAVPAPAPPPGQTGAPAGTLVRGDFLSRLLSNQELTWGMIGLGLLAAFGMGAMHALSPGHGKTIVAAYLVGSRGTIRHAIFLGAMVTFTHTISVFALGLGVLYFQQYVAPDRIIPVLGALSGLSIVFIGAWLLYQRTKALALADAQRLMHSHGEPGIHHHDHGHAHAHAHHHHHAHSHGGGSEHSHVIPEGEVSLGSLIALGVSGGLVPCPSALILMLSAIGIGRTAFGLGMLVMFSAGLALVLMAIGMMVIYAKHLLPESGDIRSSPFFRLVPVFSAVVVMILGVLMTLTSMGWMRPVSFLS